MVSLDMHLQIHRLNKQYGHRPVLQDFSLSVQKGERVAIVGPSGVGKTTLLKIIAGLLPIDKGIIMLGGRELHVLPAEKRNVGMVFQDYLLFPFLTVEQNVTFGLKMQKDSKVTRDQKVNRVLQLFQIADLRHRMPHELSSGQQQRAVFARAIVLQPEVLLLDEPFANLDPHLRYAAQKVLFDLHAEFHPTTLLVSHNIEDVLLFAQRVGVLLHGHLLQCDSPEVIYERPQSVEVAQIFGNRNVIAVLRKEDRFCSEGGLQFRVPALLLQGCQPGESALLTCHPDHSQLSIARPKNNYLPATIERRSYAGNRLRYQLSIEAGEWQVLSSEEFSEGDRIYLHLPEDKLWSMKNESHTF